MKLNRKSTPRKPANVGIPNWLRKLKMRSGICMITSRLANHPSQRGRMWMGGHISNEERICKLFWQMPLACSVHLAKDLVNLYRVSGTTMWFYMMPTLRIFQTGKSWLASISPKGLSTELAETRCVDWQGCCLKPGKWKNNNPSTKSISQFLPGTLCWNSNAARVQDCFCI